MGTRRSGLTPRVGDDEILEATTTVATSVLPSTGKFLAVQNHADETERCVEKRI